MHDHIISQMSSDRKKLEFDPAFIFRMREIGPDEFDDACEKLYKHPEHIEILDRRQEDLYDVAVISSGKTGLYEVVSLGLFYYCTCRDFEFSHTGCKHIAFCFPLVCRKCLSVPVGQRGKTCQGCEIKAANEAMQNAPYMKPQTDYKPTRIGSVRI